MDSLAALLPDSVPLWAAALVVFASFFTAALTAAFGLGGGLALLAVMSAVFPAAAVIPVHGAAQAGANAGRFYLQRRDVIWPIVLWFSLGGLIGAGFGGRLAIEAPVWHDAAVLSLARKLGVYQRQQLVLFRLLLGLRNACTWTERPSAKQLTLSLSVAQPEKTMRIELSEGQFTPSGKVAQLLKNELVQMSGSKQRERLFSARVKKG